LNGDGFGDIIGRNMSNSSIKPLYGSSSGLISGQVIFVPGEPASVGFCGDVDGDGYDDISFATDYPYYYGQAFIYADTALSVKPFPEGLSRPAFELLPNYPNPFNNSTNISFRLNYEQQVKLCIYDITGRQVSELADQFFQPVFIG